MVSDRTNAIGHGLLSLFTSAFLIYQGINANQSQQQNEIYQDALRIEAKLEETDPEKSLYTTLESSLNRLKETEEYQAGFTADHSSSQLYATAVPFGMFGTLSIISSFYCGRREEEEYADNFLNKAQLI